MEKYQSDFIKKIAQAVKRYAPKYDIKVCSPIIAQAILESAFGKSKLAAYNNFFGLKAGKTYKGAFVEMSTNEYINGKNVTIKDKFRSYKTVGAGVKGYFDFINTTRYAALKNETDPRAYLEKIKAAGYATAPNYVSALIAVIEKYDLTLYDTEKLQTPAEEKQTDFTLPLALDLIAQDVIKNPAKWGCGEVRKNRLYTDIQTRINVKMTGKHILQTPITAYDFLADDIIKNPSVWGCGKDRKENIYKKVQEHINKLMR